MRHVRLFFALSLWGMTGAAWAQGAGDDPLPQSPFRLSDTITAPHSNIAGRIETAPIDVMPIGPLSRDAVGLLARRVTGLPAGLWGRSERAAIVDLLRRQPNTGLPAALALTERLALAELDAPRSSGQDGAILLARIDLLLARGALDQARALIERAGPKDRELFRRWFDISMLTGQTDRACAALRANPDIAPTYPARIFCLAQSGDWPAAALSLGTGEALGYITTDEAEVLARFLDPELFEGLPPLPPDPDITPLFYIMRASFGERPPSNGLPLAFAHADLAEQAGWRAQIDAAERLLRAGAISAGQWQEIVTARRPSASGGIWDRVAAVQRFDAHLLAADIAAMSDSLPQVVEEMRRAGLLHGFAALYAEPLMRQPLSGEAARLAQEMAFIAGRHEALLRFAVPQTPEGAALFEIAQGRPPAPDILRGQAGLAVTSAFAQDRQAPDRYRALVNENRAGEALLQAALILTEQAADADDMADALVVLRVLGQEDIARRIALQMVLLEGGARL